MTALLREAEHARVRDAAQRVRVWNGRRDAARLRTRPEPPLSIVGPAGSGDILIIGERPWWLYDRADYPGFTDEQIRAGLTVPATEGE